MRIALGIFLLCTALLPAGCASAIASTAEQVHARPIDQAIAEGVAFLKKSQNPDGSWGSGTASLGNEIVVAIPGSHQAFQAAVTALCVMALRECGEHEAHDKGLEFLLTHMDIRRADAGLLYNVWAHTYVVQALSIESRTNHDPRIARVINFNLDRMARYETFVGGWNYYDLNVGGQRPAMGPTSFGTAAGLWALYEAKAAGFDVSMPMVQRAVNRLEEMLGPDGACSYGWQYRYFPGIPANLARGSAGRAVATESALLLWDSKQVNAQRGLDGLEIFFREHASIEAGRKRNYPHQSWYQVSGYYYYFDHYYTGRLIQQLGPEAKRLYGQKLIDVILPHQEPDGSWWDYPMWDYHKPYGTAFALMTLLRCK